MECMHLLEFEVVHLLESLLFALVRIVFFVCLHMLEWGFSYVCIC